MYVTFALGTFATCVFGVAYCATLAIYRLFLHPLAKFPGPWTACLSNKYMAYHSLKGDLHLVMHRLHDQYGDVVRCGPNRVIVRKGEAVRVLYNSGSGVHKSRIYDVMAHGALNILTLRDKKIHASRRRVVSQGLSENALRSYEADIQGQINELCEQIQTRCGDDGGWSVSMDMSSWCNYLFFDIMTQVIFGLNYHLLSREEYRHLPQAIEDSNIRMSVLLSDDSWKWVGLDKRLFPESIEGRSLFLKFVGKILQDRGQRKDGQQNADVFSVLLKTRDPETGEKLSPKQMAAESVTLIVAGADTSSTAFAAWLFYISRNPLEYARVAQEVRSLVITEGITSTQLHLLPYLRLSITEAMRMSPPVGGPMWRETSEIITVGDVVLPKGCDVGVAAYAMHHDAKVYEEPFVYRPERWQGASHEQTTAFIPFSAGSRGCIGRSLAMREMMLAAATLLLRFDFRIAEGSIGHMGEGRAGLGAGRHREAEYQLYEHVTSAKRGPCLQFKARKLT